MSNQRKSFDDKQIKCKSCFAPVGVAMIDQQVLIIGEIAFYNFCRFSCLRCESVNEWTAPNLTDKQLSLSRRFPDRLTDLPEPEKHVVNRLGVKGVSRTVHGTYKVRIVVDGETKYLGTYPTIAEAQKVYQSAEKRLPVVM